MIKILILASGLSANQIKNYDYVKNGWTIVVVNHGWLATNDWSYHLIPSDYEGKLPKYNDKQIQINEAMYWPELDKFGGVYECGLSITLSAAYWSLGTFNPNIIGFLGADMNYTPNENGHTHIYGIGVDIKTYKKSDPDRMVEMAKLLGKDDPEYLNNIYKRFKNKALELGCEVYNLSNDPLTRLPYDQIDVHDIDK